MSEAIVAKRYADALFQLADEKNQAETLINELEIVKEVFNENDKLVQLLNHPQVSNKEKMNLIDEAFGKCSKDIVNTLKLLIQRHRINLITLLIDQVTALYHDANGIAVANVRSVRQLSDSEKQKVASSLAKQLKKKEIIIKNEIDPSLLGGLKIRVGNTIYDGTISGKLNQMKHKIVASTI